MNEFSNIYFVERNDAKMQNMGETRIKFRAPSFANAKLRRYKIPVEPTVNQVETENKVNDSKDYELSTRSQERVFHKTGARERALKLKEGREKKLASIPAVISNSSENIDVGTSTSIAIEEEKSGQEKANDVSTAISDNVENTSSYSKPAALEDTQFDLGGVLETVKHANETKNATGNAISIEEQTEKNDESKASSIVDTSMSFDSKTAEEQTSSVVDEEIDATIDFSSKDTEQIYNELVKARDETTSAMEKASVIAAKVEKAKNEFNKKIEESDQKLQEAGAEMENTKLQAEASQTRYNEKVAEFRNAATAQSRSLKAQRDQALQAAVTSERELEELNRSGQEKLDENKKKIASYNSQSKQHQATIDEYNEKTDRLDAILKAISEPIEAVGNYIPSPSVAHSMVAQDSNGLEFSEPVVAVKKVA